MEEGLMPNLISTIDAILENSKFQVLKPEERLEIRSFLINLYLKKTSKLIMDHVPEHKITELKEILLEDKNTINFLKVNVPNFDELILESTADFLDEFLHSTVNLEEESYAKYQHS